MAMTPEMQPTSFEAEVPYAPADATQQQLPYGPEDRKAAFRAMLNGGYRRPVDAPPPGPMQPAEFSEAVSRRQPSNWDVSM